MKTITISKCQLLMISSLIGLIHSGMTEERSFFCTEHDVKMLDDKLKIYQFFTDDEFIFVVFKQEIISFKLPVLLDDRFESNFLPIAYKIDEINTKDHQIYGHLFELELKNNEKNNYQLFRTNENENFLKPLDLNDLNDLKDIGQKKNHEQTDAFVEDYPAIDTTAKSIFCYKASDSELRKELEFGFNYYEDDVLTIRIIFRFVDDHNESYEIRTFHEIKLDYKVNHAIFRMKAEDLFDFLRVNKMPQKDESSLEFSSDNFLIEIDDGGKIYFTKFTIKINYKGEIELVFISKITFRFFDLFSCQKSLVDFKKLENRFDVKGIFYDNKNKIFFIIMRTFYLRILDDLMITNFNLTSEQYNKTHEFVFKLKTEIDLRTIDQFDNRWIKTDGTRGFISIGNYLFELIVDKEKNLIFKQTERAPPIELWLCKFQTLTLKRKCFCFNEKFYYLIENFDSGFDDDYNYETHGAYNLADIFHSNPHNISDERAQFIFSYNSDYVLMTDQSIYLLKSQNLRRKSYDRLNYNTNVTRLKNNLFIYEPFRQKKFYLSEYIKIEYFFPLLIIIIIILVKVNFNKLELFFDSLKLHRLKKIFDQSNKSTQPSNDSSSQKESQMDKNQLTIKPKLVELNKESKVVPTDPKVVLNKKMTKDISTNKVTKKLKEIETKQIKLLKEIKINNAIKSDKIAKSNKEIKLNKKEANQIKNIKTKLKDESKKTNYKKF